MHRLRVFAAVVLIAAHAVVARAQTAPAAKAHAASSSQATSGTPSASDLPLDAVSVSGEWAHMGEASGVQAVAPRTANRLRGSIAYNIGGSVLDAAPYSLTGAPVAKPEYLRQAASASVGGPLGARAFFLLTYSGSRSTNPFTSFTRVPDAAERAGDFSQLRTPVFDPLTGAPFPGNRIPASRISPAATALLGFVPLPNQNDVQNFYRAARQSNDGDALNINMNKLVLGAATDSGPASVSSIAVAMTYRGSSGDIPSPLPALGGQSRGRNIGISLSDSYSRGRFANALSTAFNRSKSAVTNQFGSTRDIAGELGIGGVSTDPFDWGLPSLGFVNYGALSDITPSDRRITSMDLSESARWTHGAHGLRWGGDVHLRRVATRAGGAARGSFTFTGASTAAVANGQAITGTGYDLADFLLGLPARALLQTTGAGTSLHQHGWNLFFQDDWRVRRTVTINAGVRYEFASPYVEDDGRLATLDVTSDFAAVAPVTAGGTGPFSGRFTRGLIDPDRNNVAPRIGVAWAAARKTVIRGGYSINYDVPAYEELAERLGAQPPFAVAETGLAAPGQPLTLQNGFAAVAPRDVTNSFAVDRHLQAGVAHVMVLELQRQITPTFTWTTTYTNTYGRHLAMLRAPSRVPAGVRTPGAQPFLWQSSEGQSTLSALGLSVRKTINGGSSVNASYTYSRSRDNDPSLGGSDVPQNDRDLAAEWGRSSFDRRHRAAIAATIALPWKMAWTADVESASGLPFTARVLGDFVDVARGPYGALRANATGAPVTVADAGVARAFNTAAFSVPAPGQFGTAARNTISGPAYFQANMTMVKTVAAGQGRSLEMRVQMSNVFNTPQFTSIDTYVNSPTYGRVTSAGAMRRTIAAMRLNF